MTPRLPERRTSIFCGAALLSVRKLEENQDFISGRQSEKKVSRCEFVGEVKLGIIRVPVKTDTKFTEDTAKRKKVND